MQELAPELIVVAAYGRILPEDILDDPKYGSINVHSSLLPKYRGAAPINWAILNGEAETGVSIMYMAKELDAGDVILQKATPIGPDEDCPGSDGPPGGAGRGGPLSRRCRPSETAPPSAHPRTESRQTYASMLTKEMSPIDWSRSARAIDCQVRGLIPWPCATAELAGQPLQGLPHRPRRSTLHAGARHQCSPPASRGSEVACGDGESLYLTELQAEGGKRMSCRGLSAGPPWS